MADPNLQIRGAGEVIQTLRYKDGGGGGLKKKNVFRPLRPHFGLKIRGPSPGSATARGYFGFKFMRMIE